MKKGRPIWIHNWTNANWLLHHRWPWHLSFWVGYALFRSWPYYLTLRFFNRVYLEYMLLSEILFAGIVYLTLWLYSTFFRTGRYASFFTIGSFVWIAYCVMRIRFQMYYLRNEKGFQANFNDLFLSNVTFVLVCFLFVTACKYFKDGYISQQFEKERKQQQLVAEVNNLKSQIAPHFLFNTLNNLYGLAVQKSDKLPDLMLRLSDLLRHSLYETQKPLVFINDEISVLKSYTQLESVRLEDDLKLSFDNRIPEDSPYLIAPLLLIVFIENAFKHARLVQSEPVDIQISTCMREEWFSLSVKNNYNHDKQASANGIGLSNVKRRLEVLYPDRLHHLTISKDESFYGVMLELKLERSPINESAYAV